MRWKYQKTISDFYKTQNFHLQQLRNILCDDHNCLKTPTFYNKFQRGIISDHLWSALNQNLKKLKPHLYGRRIVCLKLCKNSNKCLILHTSKNRVRAYFYFTAPYFNLIGVHLSWINLGGNESRTSVTLEWLSSRSTQKM